MIVSLFERCAAGRPAIDSVKPTDALKLFQLGELLNQLLHAVLLKLYCNLRVIPIALALKDDAFAVFRMPDPRTLRPIRSFPVGAGMSSFGLANFARTCPSAIGEEARYVVERARSGLLTSRRTATAARAAARTAAILRFVFVTVVPLALFVGGLACAKSVRATLRIWRGVPRARKAVSRELPAGAEDSPGPRPGAPEPLRESAKAPMPPACRSRSGAGSAPASSPACPSHASCPRSRGGALPQARSGR